MRLNKKGFTLVELLAVIVILAVVMLIAVTSVGPMMEKSRKSSLGTEGLAMLDAAETAFQAEGLKGASAKYTATTSVCYDLAYLCAAGYFEKGCGTVSGTSITYTDGYEGSVLASYAGGKVTYTFWLTNGTYTFGTTGNTNGVSTTTYGDIENTSVVNDYDNTHKGDHLCGYASATDTKGKVAYATVKIDSGKVKTVVYGKDEAR